jgi:hypothetical protein
VLLAAAALAACAPQSEPRTAFDFREDGIAREGVLTRCSQDRDAALTDEECANARRAAAAIALEGVRARTSDLERAADAKPLALRQRDARRIASEHDAATALATAEAAYEARLRNSTGESGLAARGPVMQPMRESVVVDVYGEAGDPLGRRSLEIAAAEPPANDLLIQSPELELADLEIVPQPLRTAPE